MYPSRSYESQLPGTQGNIGGFGFNPAVGSFGQAPLQGERTASMGRQEYPWPPQSQNQYMSAPTYDGPGASGTKMPGECDDECAEEECDPDHCGDEQRGPNPDGNMCGLELRPLLP